MASIPVIKITSFYGMFTLVMTFVIVAALEATFKHIKYYEYYKKDMVIKKTLL